METRKAIAWGWIAGVTTFAVGTVAILLTAFSVWSSNVAYHKDHILPGWAKHTGTVTHVGQPRNVDTSTPYVGTTVSYLDYRNTAQKVSVKLPSVTQVRDKIEVDVKNNGEIYTPTDIAKSWKGPFAADNSAVIWVPYALFFVLSFLSAIIGINVKDHAYHISKKFGEVHGRLGTR